MFIILTYDVSEESVNKVFKICKRYLRHVQNSVFEGNITLSKLSLLKKEIEMKIKREDRILIYKLDSIKYVSVDKINYDDSNFNLIE